jgi:hypothetical protein
LSDEFVLFVLLAPIHADFLYLIENPQLIKDAEYEQEKPHDCDDEPNEIRHWE